MININNLTFKYSKSHKKALNDISLNISDSEFVLITGPSGCGKTSLIRCINGLIPSFYGGEISGAVIVQNINTIKTPTNEMAKKVGMVFQDPENQLIATDVEREIAFGLENLGFSKIIIAKRIEEVLDTVGIDHLRYRQISSLSGGEKQKTAIASVLVLHPEILLLDEPTSELDPKGAEEVLHLIRRLNEDLGLTVVLIEHRIDRVIQFVDRLIVMDKSRIIFDDEPREWIKNNDNQIDIGLPPVTRLSREFKESRINTKLPLSIKQGRQFYSTIFKENKWNKASFTKTSTIKNTDESIVKISNLWYKYPEGPTALKDVTIDIKPREFIALIGRNAAGKTTLAKLLNGLLKPTKGKVMIKGLDTKKTNVENLAKYVGYVFQDPNIHLFADTVEEEITFMMNNLDFSENIINLTLEKILKKFNLVNYRNSYPRSLSSGEKQRVALASVLAGKPQILILDEPTRGLDYELKKNLMNYLINYKNSGGTVILISHDIETIAEFGERVILMSEGRIIADGDKHQVLSNSLHFSPQINRLVQPFTKYGLPSDVLTIDEIMQGYR